MPQVGKGEKFVFGGSLVNIDYSVKLPDAAGSQYKISSEGKVILMSDSRTTGGFGISRRELLSKSKLNVILEENPKLNNYELREGEFAKYKGRLYCWLSITHDGVLRLSEEILKTFSVKKGDRLLAIRGSNIALGMGVKGPLIEQANKYTGEIPNY